jgi:putative tricarboxylic transport membrane protein
MPSRLAYAIGLAVPLAIALAAVVIARNFIAPGVDLEGMARGLAGPGTWPKAMLYCAAACSVAIFIRNLVPKRETAKSAAELAEGGDADCDYVKATAGMIVLAAYGFGITQIGMPWATLAFIAAWLLLAGLRRPLPVALVSVIGTAGVLYLFVKICLMPLDRGKGVFEEATVLLYRLLGIY